MSATALKFRQLHQVVKIFEVWTIGHDSFESDNASGFESQFPAAKPCITIPPEHNGFHHFTSGISIPS